MSAHRSGVRTVDDDAEVKVDAEARSQDGGAVRMTIELLAVETELKLRTTCTGPHRAWRLAVRFKLAEDDQLGTDIDPAAITAHLHSAASGPRRPVWISELFKVRPLQVVRI